MHVGRLDKGCNKAVARMLWPAMVQESGHSSGPAERKVICVVKLDNTSI